MKKTVLFAGLLFLLTTLSLQAQLPRVPWTSFVPKTQGLPIQGSFPNTLTVCATLCDYTGTAAAYTFINTLAHDTGSNKWAVILYPNATDDGGSTPTGVTKLSYTAAAPTTYAASVSAGGPATTATSLATAPTACTAGSLARGVDVSGNSLNCGVVAIFLGVGNTAGRPSTCTAASSTAVSAYLDTQVPAVCYCLTTNIWKCAGIS